MYFKHLRLRRPPDSKWRLVPKVFVIVDSETKSMLGSPFSESAPE
jgi:hypothetical protein